MTINGIDTVNRKDTNRLGAAAELRVMSELLLRGYNPAKLYLEDGADLVLDNGIKIEVKSAHAIEYPTKGSRNNKGWHKLHYVFSFRDGYHKQKQNLGNYKPYDFAILWAINDNDFYIIPKEENPKDFIIIPTNSQSTKWLRFRNNWEMLNRR